MRKNSARLLFYRFPCALLMFCAHDIPEFKKMEPLFMTKPYMWHELENSMMLPTLTILPYHNLDQHAKCLIYIFSQTVGSAPVPVTTPIPQPHCKGWGMGRSAVKIKNFFSSFQTGHKYVNSIWWIVIQHANFQKTFWKIHIFLILEGTPSPWVLLSVLTISIII